MDDIGLSFATFRIHDPALGRWLQIDPLAEAVYNYSPFNAMNNNPISLSDRNGDLPFWAAAAIGAVFGGVVGGYIAHKNNESVWAGAVSGAIIGAGIGLGVSSIASSYGLISGIASKSPFFTTTTAWNTLSNSIITGNINLFSSFVQGRTLEQSSISGLVGLGAGAIGGYVGSQVTRGVNNAGTLSQLGIKVTNYTTNGINGAADRFFNAKTLGYTNKESLIEAGFGLTDGLLSSYLMNNDMFTKLPGKFNKMNRVGQTGRYLSSALSGTITSVPGLGIISGVLVGYYGGMLGGLGGLMTVGAGSTLVGFAITAGSVAVTYTTYQIMSDPLFLSSYKTSIFGK